MVISSFVKNSDLLSSKLSVASDDKISILPTYVPKFVSIPINASNKLFSTENLLSIELMKSSFALYNLIPSFTL